MIGSRTHAIDALADRPSLLPRRLLATGRALGILGGAVAAAGLSALAWGACERRLPVLRRQEVTLPGHEGEAPVRILHISDLHLYPGQEFIVDFLHRVAAEEQIDLVVSTGDNFGLASGYELVERAYAPFLGLPGVCVLGSNDYYSARRKSWGCYLRGASTPPTHSAPDLPWTQMVRLLREAGWYDLSNRSAYCEVPTADGRFRRVAFLGTDDAHIHRDRITEPVPQWSEESVLRIGVTHAPYRRVLDAFTDAKADLIFAGHTHGGQIGLPGFGAILTNSDLDRRYAKGLHSWETPSGRTLLNVSAGLGTSPYAPIRIATRPEATLLVIR